jgi:hypothetical protein
MEMVRVILYGELVDTSLKFETVNLDHTSNASQFYRKQFSKKNEEN